MSNRFDRMEKWLDRIDSMLKREQSEILQSKRANHSAWDNQTLALSTASIGFAFTFLPIATGDHRWLVFSALLYLVAAILISIINFSVTADAYDDALSSVESQLLMYDKVRRFVIRSNQQAELGSSSPSTLVEQALSVPKEFDKIFSEFNVEAASKRTVRFKYLVTLLNKLRGALFVLGVASLTIFGALNIDSVRLNLS